MKLIYIVSPYTHPDKEVEQSRYEQVSAWIVKNLNKRYFFFSPILYWHPTAKANSLDTTYKNEYNRLICEDMLSRADEVWVLKLPGWKESFGVSEEIKYAERLSTKVKYIKV